MSQNPRDSQEERERQGIPVLYRYSVYVPCYQEFFRTAPQHKGYDFEEAPVMNVPPPIAQHDTPLSWWSWDRPRRIRRHLHLRDAYQDAILRLRHPNHSPSSTETVFRKVDYRERGPSMPNNFTLGEKKNSRTPQYQQAAA
ncbi:MAG: hypothetical protein D6704_11095 [Nitrospirae bacterium]|nr:MAG: hypothetical protein D6704_11095 [Nitrospirota bacterium]